MVTDVNDHTPQCVQTLFSFDAAEANLLRVELGSVMATDGDGSDVASGQLSYRLGSTNLRNNITVSSSVRLHASFEGRTYFFLLAQLGCGVW